ncbi:hypothetical protein [Neisseria mucosa]|mgnify:FL=1|uniref:Uncharacterized protein n=1 Tax=Neisseria mucosa C102 TaxID=435832 RepID=A0ABN0CA91_NEIMU|nr:hypothetical protein [Neisseria mucosa]EFV80180.1 hypothetical protein HMPREF0604_01701 [Neisseria mucosa C102]QKI22534.1 hypothetical protein FOC66_06655 [Neisseria mucosa]
MNFPRISEKKFAGLSLAGSIVIIITTSIWFYLVGPEGFDGTLIAGMLMLVSANLVYALFYRRLRPATLAGSLWATAIVWVWYMIEVLDELAYIRHGSGDLWFVLPLFYGISLIASIIATAARTKLLSLEKSSLQAFWASMSWSFIGNAGLLWIFYPIALLIILGIVLLINLLVKLIDSSMAPKRMEDNTSNHSNLPSDS